MPDEPPPTATNPANDPFFAHEALDRCHMIASMFDGFVATHPFVEANGELEALVENVEDAIGELYQAIGALTMKAKSKG